MSDDLQPFQAIHQETLFFLLETAVVCSLRRDAARLVPTAAAVDSFRNTLNAGQLQRLADLIKPTVSASEGQPYDTLSSEDKDWDGLYRRLNGSMLTREAEALGLHRECDCMDCS